MELDCWCTCGKQIYDPNALYCSKDCANADNIQPSLSTKAVPQTPPVNLHFSITIPPNLYRASDSNAKVLSSPLSTSSSSSFTSIYTHDQHFNENYDYVYTGNNHRDAEEMVDDEYYPPYYSTSEPIDIPRNEVVSDPSLEPNKGTFGKEKSIF